MLFFSRFTDTSFVPGRAATLFSTRAEQAAQVIPVIVYVSFIRPPYVHTPRGYYSLKLSIA